MKGEAKKKVKGGKLIKVEIWYEDSIEKAMISGDFFLHPEEGIEDLEKSLFGLTTNSSLLEVKNRLNDAISEKKLELIGFTSDDLAEIILESYK
jgi:lipoate-protein ligase A